METHQTGPSTAQEIRYTARVIVLDVGGMILLFRIAPGLVEFDEFWITPGGGMEPGESPEQAAARELQEETGFTLSLPVSPVWTRRHTGTFNGRGYDSREIYYLCRLRGHRPTPLLSDPAERPLVVDFRWWNAEEIQRSKATFAPRRLGHLAVPVIAQTPPITPLHIVD